MSVRRSSGRVAGANPAALAVIGLVVLGCAPEISPEAEANGERPAASAPGRAGASPVRRAPAAPGVGATPSEPGGAPDITYTMIEVSAGAELEVELIDAIGLRSARPGDRFLAGVTRPLIENGMVLVPLNSMVNGEITAVEMSGEVGGEMLVKLRFSDVLFNGRNWPMSASVVEVVPAGGSAYGAVGARGPALGRIIGGHRAGTVVGAAAGAVAGTAIRLPAGEGESEAMLPAGTILRLRLDEPLVFGLPNI